MPLSVRQHADKRCAYGTPDAWTVRVLEKKRFSIAENQLQIAPAHGLLHFLLPPKLV
jgi:hypothetical protein